MKRKLLSLVLCLSLIFTTIFTGFTVVSAEEAAPSENLLKNGNFESFKGTNPANWQTRATDPATVEIVEDVEIAEDLTANAVKFSSNETSTKSSALFYNDTVKIEKNAKYTTTFWVKNTNVSGFKVSMFEPTYVAKDGTVKTNARAQEGQNIYTYTWASESTRVIRKDIVHTFKIVETDTVIDQAGASLLLSRSSGKELVLTPDYPNTQRQGEWFQIVHTFETGDDDAHEADISYEFTIPAKTADSELWIANVEMTVERNYKAQVNDDTLGTVYPYNPFPVEIGDEVNLTAEPFGENLFNGWYVGDELISTDATLTFTHNGADTPEYVAHFEETGFGTAESFEEGYANNELLAQATAGIGASDTGFTEFANTDVAGKGYFVDSSSAGTWRNATASTDYAFSGKYSLKFSGQWGCVGRKFTGLEKNTEYTVSVYAYGVNKSDADKQRASVRNLYVTAYGSFRDTTKMLKNEWDMNKTGHVNNGASIVNGWSRFEVTFNTGDNTEIIFWVDSSGDNATLYLDNFAIARETFEYTAKVNDKALGYVNPVTTRVDSKTTVTAIPAGEAIFDGWYNGDTLISKDAKISFIYSEETANYEAHFTSSGFGIDGGFENFENGTLLAQTKHTKKPTDDGTDWTAESWKDTSLDGNNEYFMDSSNAGDFRKLTVTNAYAYSGNNSLDFNGLWGRMGRKITDLEKNTNYEFSFYVLVKDSETTNVESFRVTDTNTTPVQSGATFIALDHTQYGENNKWVKATYNFNSGDNTEVVIWLSHNGDAKVYIDDMAIVRTGVSINVDNSIYGTTNFVAGKTYNYNEAVTLTATPYEGNTFDGWYVGEELVSTNTTAAFNAQPGLVITPKFSGETFEFFAANGQDGTFENGGINGITFYDPNFPADWCNSSISNANPYIGANSLLVNARYRNTIIPLTGLKKNTNYTLSFMFDINETDFVTEAGDTLKASLSAGVVTSDATHIAEDTVPLAKSGTIYSTADWQKVELSFNTGNSTDFNLIIRFHAENPSTFMYMDNLSLLQKDTIKVDLPGDIDNDNEVELSDVSALAQHLAGWTVENINEDALDLNGDDAVNLKDLVLLARYVAHWEGVTLG